jgi:F-type H+-transporting ATPase subunit delta
VARKAQVGRYSQAVFEMALETKEFDRWQSDLRQIASLAENATVIAFLESPKIRFDYKARVLSAQLEGISPLALNLAYLLVTKGRLSMIGDIADNYQRLLDNYHGIEQAEVTTAVPLDDRDKQRLAEHLSAIVGKKVALKTEVDPRLIGGIITRTGGKLLDSSTRSKLSELKRELAGGGK